MRAVRGLATVKRGDVFAVNLNNEGKRSLIRPVLVIQNDIGNRYCPSVIVVPLISKLKTKKLLFSVLIPAGSKSGLCKDHVALFSQIRTLERHHFTNDNFLGHLDFETMQKVDRAIELSLGLSTIQKLHNRYQMFKEKMTS
ncbi:type II toxin-antitoxin system PemK/MazF family toxin [Zhaonella formicivorans]|jgi:mRNA interferase MazF|uniref:type II toxin-antitoxin system PemK/MazF family toxin n=1 Tax=Zhaonella formicivorans TaxID=2528593 RepID=UPI0010F259B2|nr:type II toxin-antitoxin system PemK/MazF family toxin [Zhaonella formicivorans]